MELRREGSTNVRIHTLPSQSPVSRRAGVIRLTWVKLVIVQSFTAEEAAGAESLDLRSLGQQCAMPIRNPHQLHHQRDKPPGTDHYQAVIL